MPQKHETRVWNHTPYELADIPATFVKITQYRNNWRNRTITLYRISQDQLVSVGSCDDGDTVVVIEHDSDHARALDAAQYGRTYVAY